MYTYMKYDLWKKFVCILHQITGLILTCNRTQISQYPVLGIPTKRSVGLMDMGILHVIYVHVIIILNCFLYSSILSVI